MMKMHTRIFMPTAHESAMSHPYMMKIFRREIFYFHSKLFHRTLVQHKPLVHGWDYSSARDRHGSKQHAVSRG